ncbi:hypothetical protein V2G26_009163 [Clonostachys chloroleuca]
MLRFCSSGRLGKNHHGPKRKSRRKHDMAVIMSSPSSALPLAHADPTKRWQQTTTLPLGAGSQCTLHLDGALGLVLGPSWVHRMPRRGSQVSNWAVKLGLSSQTAGVVLVK